ncbi:uncharacterized protein BO88DRAFT_167837 [Aspergillus vadensis CBS 113365]|uniref:Uncharacterized protein n=1 Tax=Aspergillus vadensis (strain CBS 113365 / IMI 142717 / IBT 24658) TaxID=1448311 RepID=A0A319BNH8_ASPVC|nr:hypothetical protein BO88DRAFT_167837 [Aspergillus vadensis CBS 113365]PYH72700.1 hypothetical protein BO88DRAFT_167837 [Aspergillus vadensis CBS 113365]
MSKLGIFRTRWRSTNIESVGDERGRGEKGVGIDSSREVRRGRADEPCDSSPFPNTGPPATVLAGLGYWETRRTSRGTRAAGIRYAEVCAQAYYGVGLVPAGRPLTPPGPPRGVRVSRTRGPSLQSCQRRRRCNARFPRNSGRQAGSTPDSSQVRPRTLLVLSLPTPPPPKLLHHPII